MSLILNFFVTDNFNDFCLVYRSGNYCTLTAGNLIDAIVAQSMAGGLVEPPINLPLREQPGTTYVS